MTTIDLSLTTHLATPQRRRAHALVLVRQLWPALCHADCIRLADWIIAGTPEPATPEQAGQERMCPACGVLVRVRLDGRLRVHDVGSTAAGYDRSRRCDGSGG